MTKRQDPEIIAMRACWKALRPFDTAARHRMVQWLASHINDLSEPEVKGNTW